MKGGIGFEIRVLANLIKRNVGNLPALKAAESITGIHCWMIGYIYERQGEDVYQKDIEERFSIRRSTATTILQRMEKNGLIVRCPVAHDARLKKLELTEKAIKLQEQINLEIEAFEERLVAGLNEGERQIFHEIMDKLKHNLEG
ncbi:MarR family winged helix-turn-helix transcriptional regulator [Cellulosilyticum ruminicola]|uniref:MarR family winged helix-turn-helix transcriptional regulator n=1 Tax=Cellulosilyticum ruminicola TaxID=425254 RepID=UPI0006D04101|nr:MarR family winged helix-turn-helix transcriptional regulator [Cellulosilyticum ruminicola]